MNSTKGIRRLASAVISKAITDALAIDVRASEHQWTEEGGAGGGDPQHRSEWVRQRLSGLTGDTRTKALKKLMVADAHAFLFSKESVGDRLFWFNAAGLDCPDEHEMRRVLVRWLEPRTSSEAESSLVERR